MRKRYLPVALLTFAGLSTCSILAQPQARVEAFSPQGTVKGVRQVRVRFSEAMVPFGDPRAASPFDYDCPVEGTARWVDERNWVLDFERDLPGGISCDYRVKEGLRSLAGNAISGQRRFRFSTGGPAILSSRPYSGSQQVDEEQIFILELDCAADETSVLANAGFAVEEIASRIGVSIVAGARREEILASQSYLRRRDIAPERILLIRARQRFPAGRKVSLIWGSGITSRGGVANEQDQVLPFVVRPPFSANFSCQRENPEADCVPLSSMVLRFTAPVLRKQVEGAVLKGSDGKQWLPETGRAEDEEQYLYSLTFAAPFPEKSSLALEIPAGVRDDAGRPLSNADKFPLEVKTDEYPALAKFAADFGILELSDNPLLPLTLRNVEPTVAGRVLPVPGGEGYVEPRELKPEEKVASRLEGKIYKVPATQANQMLHWIKTIQRRTWKDRGTSIFGPVTSGKTRAISVPKLEGGKAFEVVGIPLKSPGFYVVEIESELLGAALMGQPKPMYVPTTALVTNLSVHFKWGIDASLVWVTSLDKADPVPQAAVEIRDCEGSLVWEGATGPDGIARPRIPPSDGIPSCSYDPLDRGLVVGARRGDDMAFVHSSWSEGIEPWRFQLPVRWNRRLEVMHTIFDRTLLRAGETVHMKHIFRREGTGGFELAPGREKEALVIRHGGSDQRYELPLHWDANGIAETSWQIPKDARLGQYSVSAGDRTEPDTFRVEEFRVPLMKGVIRPPAGNLVQPTSIPLDLSVLYLAGGGASQAPVRLRYQLQPRAASGFEDFEGFIFSNGRVREGLVRRGESEEEPQEREVHTLDLTLDASGSAQTSVPGPTDIDRPMALFTELEFRDPNGENQTVASVVPLWHADRLVGIKPTAWQSRSESVRAQIAVTDLQGRPVSDATARVDLYQRKTYSHRKRLVGGYYGYEHSTEVRRLESFCEGKTDPQGLLTCERSVEASGNLILQAVTRDSAGRETAAYRDIWVAGKEAWWFQVEDADRIDLIPEKKRYEPGERARFQVRMPFRQATALVTVEREGVGEAFVQHLSGNEPVIEIPVRGEYAPNIYLSALLVRGRADDVQPTATVDLGRPAFKLGIASIDVGWRAHELKVRVAAERKVYKVREKARVRIEVRTADGKNPPAGSEVAVAAVDEGLLELMPNESWNLLEAMMARRSYGVQTSTAQMHVVGKRHFGLKALPQGGGGGAGSTRELFDTLLLWRGRVKLDRNGRASLEIPLNDSVTSFRIAAVANGGVGMFGTGSTSIRSSQDLVIFSGIPPLVRQGDSCRSSFTVRNATGKRMDIRVSADIRGLPQPVEPMTLRLGSGESKEIGWQVTVPASTETLTYKVEARGSGGASDTITVNQRVIPVVRSRTFQATITQLEDRYEVEVERPSDALPDQGGVAVTLQPTILAGMDGVREFMQRYPYRCLEQLVSSAIALRDRERWDAIMDVLPLHLDPDGLARYFPSIRLGSDSLTAYILAIAQEAGWEIPEGYRKAMLDGLRAFVDGRVIRYSSLPTADLSIRKVAAIEALSRYQEVGPELLSSVTVSPNLWPTSAVLDWRSILNRSERLPRRAEGLAETEQILRARLSFQGSTMGFSTEGSDHLWWLMVSTDGNAVRFLRSVLEAPGWRDDIPRLVRGALGRLRRGHWSTTVANAWGVLALEKFAALFEQEPVAGQSIATLAGASQAVDWTAAPGGATLEMGWPRQRSPLQLRMAGTGRPWATVRSIAAIPLKESISAGFTIRKSMAPVQQKEKSGWSVGDIVRVKLELESTSDMTWVAVNDPIPAGAAILGTGLGRDSQLATQGEKSEGWVWPAFEERSFESFRAYYEYVPKGRWTLEYTLRLNSSGRLQLPSTRVEALYAPEMFAEIPNEAVVVR